MRYLLSILFACFVIAGCSKNAAHVSNGLNEFESWLLVQKVSSFGSAAAVVTTPAANSSVTLALMPGNTYQSLLNSDIVCQGSYSIVTDTTNNYQTLYLNNFAETGIFNLFMLEEVGQSGQIISSSDGMTMKVSNDTLTLTSPLTPGGYEYYTFVKQ